MIEIKHRWTVEVLHRSEAESVRGALIEALAGGANLRGANLGGADLGGADLGGADLRGADLSDADLRGADLSDADLRGADLSDADFSDADLSDADLGGTNLSGANLSGANLSGANLRGANLRGANLGGADLSEIRDDLTKILDVAPAEVPGLLVALREGRIDGSTYTSECACLVGTIAQVRRCDVDSLPDGIRPDPTRPAERWFLAIRPGDTPDRSQPAAITVEWVEQWMRDNGQVVPRAIKASQAIAFTLDALGMISSGDLDGLRAAVTEHGLD